MKTYDIYKDSSIQWIGEIPEHWEVKKLKYCADLINGYSFKPEQYTNEGIPVIRIGDLDYEVNIENAKKVDFELLENLKDFLIKKGDILLALTGATIGKSALFDKDDLVFLNQRVGILRTKDNVEKQYLRYVIMSNIFREFVDLFCGGSAQENIGKAQLDNYFLQLPSLPEQTAIANYLDTKTTEIDQIITDKEALINLYEEEKKALINEAVTKGVTLSEVETSAPKLKSSGVDWLGDVPEHWEVKKLKYVVSCNDEVLPESTARETIFHYVEIGDVNLMNGIEKFTEINFGESPSRARRIAKYGDIIISTVRTYLGAIARIDDTIENLIVSTGFAVLRAQMINSLFLGFFVKSQGFIDQVISQSTGVSYPAISASQLMNIEILVPNPEEQTAIVRHIETKTTQINNKINLIKQEIELLKEYRQALIFEAVTGKICVL